MSLKLKPYHMECIIRQASLGLVPMTACHIEAENEKLAIVEIGNIFPRNLFCNSRKVNVTIFHNILVNDLFSL